jgi:hypothetical protein
MKTPVRQHDFDGLKIFPLEDVRRVTDGLPWKGRGRAIKTIGRVLGR